MLWAPHGRHLGLLGGLSSLSVSLSTHLALLVWLRSSVRLRFRVTSRAGEWRAPASHRSRLRNLEQVFGCQPTSGRGLSSSSARLFRLHSCLQVALCVLNASAPTLPHVRPLTGRSKDAHCEERHRGRMGCQSGNDETFARINAEGDRESSFRRDVG